VSTLTEQEALAQRARSGEYDHLIVTAPGDGVGPDVVAAARRVLDAAGSRFGFRIQWQEIAAGGCAIDAHGVAIREEDLQVADTADAILLGAVGGPQWDNPNASVRPEQALFALRTRYELFANLRPVTILPELYDASPLKSERLVGVDLMMVRELTGGLYFGKPSGEEVTPTGRRAVDTLPYHEDEIRRIAVIAFELARTRSKRLASIDKANVLENSVLWRKTVIEIAKEYPDVALNHLYVDNAAMQLIKAPKDFDVMLAENLFGDILSDEMGAIAGSIGMLPSASLGTAKTGGLYFGLFEPGGGSAPDIAGKGIANPLAQILSVAMMLRFALGEFAAADAIEAAVKKVIEAGLRTGDIWSEGTRKLGTAEMGAAVAEAI